MKFCYVAALLLGASLVANAQGYKDGVEYYKAGQYDNAISILTRNMNSADTDKALANYYMGQSYLSKGDQAKAKQFFDAGIAANPNCGYNYAGLGAIELLNKNKSGAESNFKKAQDLEKKNSDLTVDIARAYYNADPVLYSKEIDKKIEQAKKESKGEEVGLLILIGDRLAREGNFNEATPYYEQALTKSNKPEAYVKYANAYYYTNPDYAIQILQRLLQANPTTALGQRELAEKYYGNGQLTKAAAQYGQYMANPNHFSQDKARYVVLLYADKKYQDAITNAREVLKETPNDLTMDRIIYLSYDELGNQNEALNAATAFFNNPEYKGRYNTTDYITYAQLLTKAGKTDEAEKILNQGIAANPSETLFLQTLADTQSKAGRSGDALETFDKYLKALENPTAQDYNNGSIYALTAVSEAKDNADLRNKYSDMGIAYLNQVIDPANPRVNYSLRKVQILLNRNLGSVDADAEAAILDLINIMDKEPTYSDPTNPDNSLNVYRLLYNQLVAYYNGKGDKAATADAQAKFKKYDDLYNSIAK